MWSVHPRIRGEHWNSTARPPSASGSSPHTRGTLVNDRVERLDLRFIPAYAGNTQSKSVPSPPPPVHPRIRGEHVYSSWSTYRSRGSSPHTRGTRDADGHPARGARFIPAYAGNTCSPKTTGGRHSVHPRIRGEHIETGILSFEGAGSSPHTRGTHHQTPRRRPALRFIPAYAGNTSPFRADVKKPPVHPRIRGEHMPRRSLGRPIRGSSPHTRGTPSVRLWRVQIDRFIPAYAGNTPALSPMMSAWAVHPRIRGEHGFSYSSSFTIFGSSPHTRGTPEQSLLLGNCRRFIPAYAGNTVSSTVDSMPPTVHPRIRGEHVSLRAADKSSVGSSPHTRGTRTCSGPS